MVIVNDVLAPLADADEDAASAAFFELAQARSVGFRLPDGSCVTVCQSPELVDSSGGVIWETAYLLSLYLTGALSPSGEPDDPALFGFQELLHSGRVADWSVFGDEGLEPAGTDEPEGGASASGS